MIAQSVVNSIGQLTFLTAKIHGGRGRFKPVELERFIPDYLGNRKTNRVEKSLKDQEKEFAAFAMKLKAVKGQAS